MGQFASKGVGTAALTTGIIGAVGTSLGVLGNGGLNLGGLMGGNRMGAELQYVSSLQAENATLKADRHSDNNDKEVYKQALADNTALRNEFYANINPVIENIHQNAVNVARLEEQLKCCCEKQELREQIILGKVNEVASTLGGQISAVSAGFNSQIACINNTLANITKTVVPNTAVCPGWGNVTVTPATSGSSAAA